MSKLHIDIETFSTENIKLGTYKYAEGAELLLFAYAWDEDPVHVLDCVNNKDAILIAKHQLQIAIKNKVEVYAHNSQFERVVLSKFFDEAKQINWLCTKIRAYAHSLPGGLFDLSNTIYKLSSNKAKDKKGRELIRTFCVMQKKRKDGKDLQYRIMPSDEPELWKQFIEYCRLDVEAERALEKLLPKWNDTETERELFFLDQKINDRGFQVDTNLAVNAIDAVQKDKKQKDDRTHSITKGVVNAATQRDAMLKHILEVYNVELPDMTTDTLTRRLEDSSLPEPVKELIRLRLQSSGTSTKKYQTLLNSKSEDNRLRGALQFCGASRTGRWSGRVFQPQNLPRPKFENDTIDIGIEALKYQCADILFEDVKAIATSAVRGSIISREGCKLVVADLSSIEGRGLAWLAGEQWKLNAYRDYDIGIGEDMYKSTYARTFNVPIEGVTKDQRQQGKVLELFGGYGGGVGAFVTFGKVYGVDLESMADTVSPILPHEIKTASEKYVEYLLSDSEEKKKLTAFKKMICPPGTEQYSSNRIIEIFVSLDSIKRLWRKANPAIVHLWKQIAEDCIYTIHTGKKVEREKYEVTKKGVWLRIKLPSGRYLCYPGIKVIDDRKIQYLGMDYYTHKWGKIYTYGGKLVENLTQALCRDVFAHGMLLAEQTGYWVVLSEHDELLTETPDTAEYNHQNLSKLMSTNPSWAPDLPLAAAGFEAYRYRKD